VGVDIHGWIEVKAPMDEWRGVVKLDGIGPDRVHDMFGCLFGVMNLANFRPIAPERGLPADLSYEVTEELVRWPEEWGQEPCWPTWITGAEIVAIDWDEESEKADGRIHRYKRRGDGELFLEGKSVPRQDSPVARLKEGEVLEADDIVYKAERIRRKDTLSGNWQLLFKLMATLSEHYGQESVRMVVWFDY
jgi:hypothetical protein